MITFERPDFNKDFENEFEASKKRIEKMQRTIGITSVIWGVFALGTVGTLIAVSVHFLRKIW